MKKLSNKNLNAIIMVLLLTVLFNIITLFIENVDNNTWILCIALIIFLSYTVDLLLLKTIGYPWISVGVFFFLFSVLFHMGQVFILAISKKYNYVDYNVISDLGKVSKNTILFCHNIIQLIVTGMCFSKTNVNKSKAYDRENGDSIIILKISGWLICIICLPMKIRLLLAAIQQIQDVGAYKSVIVGYSGLYMSIANFFLIGYVLLILGYSKEKVKCRLILFLEIVSLLMMMMSGGRMTYVITLIMLFLCYFKCVETFNVKYLIIFFPIIYFTLNFVTAVSTLRTQVYFSLEDVVMLALFPENNIVLRLMDEFGQTVHTVKRVMIEVPENFDYHYGLSYIKSFLLISLNFGGFLNDIVNSIEFVTLFQHKYSYGGSYIGELYYNFGQLSYFFASFFGYVIGKISRYSDKLLKDGKLIQFSYLIMPIYSIFLWVRGYFEVFIRNVVWGMIFLSAIFILTKNIYPRISKYRLNVYRKYEHFL